MAAPTFTHPLGGTITQATTTLYERLGRREGITCITRSPLQNHMANPLVKTRYEASENLERVEQRVIEFFCAGTGGRSRTAAATC